MSDNQKRNTGLLNAEEYKPRYSETLIKNPNAKLEEFDEIKKYFSHQTSSYINSIDALSSLDTPLSSETRVIVTIISYGEGHRIKNTLELYLNQDIDFNLFEIILLDNHPENVDRDNTEEEVKKFIQENPNIKVIYAYKTWKEGEYAAIGNARKHVFDISLNRILRRGLGFKDTILISNDADAISYDSNYLSSIIKKFDSSPEVDALVTKMSIPDYAMAKPNIAVATEILDLMERVIIKENKDLGEPADPVIFVGRSCAMRSSIIAASGGCNQRATVHDDRELGWIISDARNWDPKRIIQFDETSMVTDPRRHLDALASGLLVDLMLFNFHVKPELRQMNNEEVLKLIPDDVDWELLQEEIDSTWMSQFSGNKLYANKFEACFRFVMDKLGIDYEIINGHVSLKSIDKLLENLSHKYGKKVNIKHSKPIVYTPDLIQEIKIFFSSLSEGAIGARKLSINR